MLNNFNDIGHVSLSMSEGRNGLPNSVFKRKVNLTLYRPVAWAFYFLHKKILGTSSVLCFWILCRDMSTFEHQQKDIYNLRKSNKGIHVSRFTSIKNLLKIITPTL